MDPGYERLIRDIVDPIMKNVQNKHDELKKYFYKGETMNINTLVGKTIVEITGAEKGNDEIYFICDDGTKYLMYHELGCCESVSIDDIVGNVNDLIGSPILQAEERSNSGDVVDNDGYCHDTYTWTFYSFRTLKGYVDIKWYGTSNGYYSESVDFVEVKDEHN